jgi:molecular chaperone DnaK
MGIAKTYHQAPEGFRSAAEVGSKLLQFIAGESSATSALPLKRVVVTVPASFQAPQREDTVNAALQAQINLQNGDLLDEPVAAFIDFICSYPKKFSINPGESKHVLVFDFGGGTCDVAVLKLTLPIASGGLQIDMRSVSRYHRLGGGDIDRAIVYEILIPQLMSQNGLDKYDLSYEDKKNFLEPALIGFAEALKIKISNEIDRLMRFNKYHDSDKNQIITKLPQTSIFNVRTKQYVYKSPQLTAAEFEKVLEPFMDRDLLYTKEDDYRLTCSIFAPLEDGIERSNVNIDDIDYCFLVGGSSLIPQIRSAVTDYLESAEFLSFDSEVYYNVL